MDSELLVHMARVGFDGAVGKAQFLLDEHATATLREQGKNLGLMRGKARLGGNALASVAHIATKAQGR